MQKQSLCCIHPVVLVLLLLPMAMLQANEDNSGYAGLQSHEPIYIGYTWDEDDVGFMDFKLSLKYPIWHDAKPKAAAFGFLPHPYFDFSGRFGQYIGTRESSPVISKRFNPELIGRYWLLPEAGSNLPASSFDLMYGHESNGQNVGDYNSYLAMELELALQGEDLKYADDYISRGWDYVGALWSQNWVSDSGHRVTTFLKLHYFLDDGLLQGPAEEYNSWENDREGKNRRKVDGISLSYKRDISLGNALLRGEKIFLQYVTGTENTFRFNTVRAEFSFVMGNLPLMFWVSHGYNSDLADYYRELSSGGIAIEFLSM